MSDIFDQSRLDLAFHFSSDEPMVIIRSDGQLEYGPGYTPDDAAHAFWTAVNHHGPNAENVRLRAERDELRNIVYLYVDPFKVKPKHKAIIDQIEKIENARDGAVYYKGGGDE